METPNVPRHLRDILTLLYCVCFRNLYFVVGFENLRNHTFIITPGVLNLFLLGCRPKKNKWGGWNSRMWGRRKRNRRVKTFAQTRTINDVPDSVKIYIKNDLYMKKLNHKERYNVVWIPSIKFNIKKKYMKYVCKYLSPSINLWYGKKFYLLFL